MRYFLIRHKATGEFMPQAKKRGYSHWNPAVPGQMFDGSLGVPRLIDTRRRAARCIVQWAANPNARMDIDGDIVIKDDGRKREDLEIVEVDIVEVGVDWGKGESYSEVVKT